MDSLLVVSNSTRNNKWAVYNVFLNSQDLNFYERLTKLKTIDIKGYRERFDRTNVLRASFEYSFSLRNAVIQFVSVTPIEGFLLEDIDFLLRRRVKRPYLVIFGWPNSFRQLELMLHPKYSSSYTLTIKGTIEWPQLSNFLCTFYANLHLGIEAAIQAGAFSAGIHCVLQYKDIERFIVRTGWYLRSKEDDSTYAEPLNTPHL